MIWAAFMPVLVFHLAGWLSAWIVELFSGYPKPDAALIALVTAVVSLPFLIAMKRRDRGLHFHGGAGMADGRAAGEPDRTNYCIPLHILAPFIGAALSFVFAYVMQRAGVYQRFSNASQEALMASGLFWRIAGPGLLVPIAEELTYRGLLYPRLKRIAPRGIALLLTAACFGIGHGNVIQFLYAFPMSIVLCLLYDLPGSSLLVPILVHMGANVLTLVWV